MSFFSEEMRRDPYPLYDQVRGVSPVLHLPDVDLWMIFDHAGVKRALHDPESFSSNVSPARGGVFDWLLFMDPPRHTAVRAIIMRAFTPRSIAGLEPRIRQLSAQLLDRVLTGAAHDSGGGGTGSLDLVRDFATPLPMMVMAEMIGLPGDDWPRLAGWSEAIINLADTIVGDPAAAHEASETFVRADEEMRDYLAGLLAARQRAPRDDLLTRLVSAAPHAGRPAWGPRAEVDGAGLSETELLRFIQLLLAAGTETTTNLIDNAILCLLEHPAELARLRAQPDLLPSALEEVLRYRSPAQAMFRATRRPVELAGQTIPAGKFVLALLGSANRDPQAFADPARFDITRQPNPHLAFGHGIHFCLGAALSRLEARIAVADLLARTTDLQRADDTPWTPRRAFHVHGPTHLPLRFRLPPDPGG
jgi:cytochrome P450